ncbi:hypothetical protein TWF506_007242 [Arthrobotrys conoides]|uniref:Uncharacterized protein n=1 Tax=Arthrobotrys conoides TaxID=74498 RepID=A0AAN8NNU1_9PEZI
MVSESVAGLIRRLGNAQLRSFIWRSHLEISPSLLALLANNHGTTLNCLYVDAGEFMENTEHNPDLSNFTSLDTLRWNGLLFPKELKTVFQIVKASASTLQTISFGVIHPEDELRDKLQAPWLEKLQLPALTEYQAPLRINVDKFIFNTVLPLSQIQRLYITDIDLVRRDDAAALLDSVKGLVELHYIYNDGFDHQTGVAILSHGNTLKRLYICANISQPRPFVLSAQTLVKIGRKCPNLVEIGITRRTDHSPDCSGAEGCDCPPFMVVFPLQAFTKLEVLFLSVQLKGSSSTIERDHFLNEASVRAVKCGLENTLNNELHVHDRTLIKRSTSLRIVAMGAGAAELHRYPRTQARPRLWKVDHHDCTGKGPITLHPTSFDDMDNANHSWSCTQRSQRKDCHNWKLLRRYPLLVPNEGLHRIFHSTHLSAPPASEIPTTQEYAVRKRQPLRAGLFD